jgi:LPPG:FO 2-phospho-L-lactate transferase
VNTGDDFEHWGLHVAPDVDTVMYTLANLAHVERGWGLETDYFEALAMVRRYGGDDWFALGDRDLATHLLRTQALRRGESLSAVTRRLCHALGVGATVLPMTDGTCQTLIETQAGDTLSFQDWLVRRRAVDPVRAVRFEGTSLATPQVLTTLEEAEVVVIGPSNPYVSIDPILRLPGVRSALAKRPVLAVSPLVAGRAVKGPLASMVHDLTGQSPTALALARHYGELLSGMIVERGDEDGFEHLPVLATDTIMHDRAASLRLAKEALDFAASIIGSYPHSQAEPC